MFLDGLAFKMEHGFQRTEMGRQAYAMNLAIITQAVLRTVYARIMQVLVGNRNWLSVLAAKNFPSAAVQAREISKASVNSFGCIQKNTHGLDLLMNNILRLFHDRMLSAPDAVVIPHGVMAYLSTCKPESKIYALCGALAERLGIKSERELITNVYGDSYSVFEHRPMNVANDTANEVNMLARDREVGNYWKIFRNSYGSPFSTPSAPDGQPSAIRIIDHDRQRWVTITLAEALSHSEAFDVNGNINEDGPLARFLMGPGVAKGTSGYQSMPTYAAVGGPAEDGFKRSETNRYLTERPSGEILFAMLGKQNLLPKTVSMAIRSMHAAARRLGDIRDDSGSNTLPNGFKKRIRAAINALEETSPTAPASMTATSTTAPGFDEAALKANLISSFKSVSGTTLSTDDKIVIAPELEIISRGLAGRNQPCYLFVSDRLGASQRFYTGEVNSGGTITTLNPATREETTKKIEAAFATGNFNEVVISGTVGAVATKSSVASAVSANIGSFVDDIAKGDKEKAESISLALADVMQKTNKFSKTIKKLQASNNIDDTDTSALKAASDAASQEFLKEAKKAWKDITSIAAEQGSLFGGGYDEITVGDTSDQGSASKGDAYRIWAGTDAPIGADMAGTSNRGGHYGRGGERFNGTAGDDLDFYLSLPLTLQAIEVLDSFGIVTPFGAIVFRPFQSFNMGSAVIMKSGNDTGFTCVGNSDFQLGDSVTNKTHLGHFTFYFEPVVHEPNHIMIARDVAFMGYNGGAGARWFNSWSEAGTSVLINGGVRPSLLCAIAFAHENDQNTAMDPMSISGFFAEGSILQNLEDTVSRSQGGRSNLVGPLAHYDMAKYYDEELVKNLGSNNMDDDTNSATDAAFHGTGTNYVCYQGLQCEVDTDGRWSKWTTNTGHLGDAETTDSSLAWSGHLAFKTSVNYHVGGNSISLSSKTT